MPRVPRVVLPGCPLHVVQRGLNRGACFFAEGDYVRYLRYLSSYSAQFRCSIHAYCLMTNHVHLLLTPGTPESCALLMKNLGQCYVQDVNHRLGRTGTLWEGRFKSSMVTTESYVLACYRYIELNPVRAGMVSTPAEYRWSSYATNAGDQAAGWLTPHGAYEGLGEARSHRAASYRALCDEQMPDGLLDEIRKATRVGGSVGAQRRARGRPWALNEKNRVRPYLRGRD